MSWTWKEVGNIMVLLIWHINWIWLAGWWFQPDGNWLLTLSLGRCELGHFGFWCLEYSSDIYDIFHQYPQTISELLMLKHGWVGTDLESILNHWGNSYGMELPFSQWKLRYCNDLFRDPFLWVLDNLPNPSWIDGVPSHSFWREFPLMHLLKKLPGPTSQRRPRTYLHPVCTCSWQWPCAALGSVQHWQPGAPHQGLIAEFTGFAGTNVQRHPSFPNSGSMMFNLQWRQPPRRIRGYMSRCHISVASMYVKLYLALPYLHLYPESHQTNPTFGWLVVSNMTFFFHFIYGMSSQPHWRSPSFFKIVKLHHQAVGHFPSWKRMGILIPPQWMRLDTHGPMNYPFLPMVGHHKKIGHHGATVQVMANECKWYTQPQPLCFHLGTRKLNFVKLMAPTML